MAKAVTSQFRTLRPGPVGLEAAVLLDARCHPAARLPSQVCAFGGSDASRGQRGTPSQKTTADNELRHHPILSRSMYLSTSSLDLKALGQLRASANMAE